MSSKIPPNLIDIIDTAIWLAISPRKLTGMAKRGEIPCYQLPMGDFVFDREEVSNWLVGRKRNTAESAPRKGETRDADSARRAMLAEGDGKDAA
jgi:hypothetical protein